MRFATLAPTVPPDNTIAPLAPLVSIWVPPPIELTMLPAAVSDALLPVRLPLPENTMFPADALNVMAPALIGFATFNAPAACVILSAPLELIVPPVWLKLLPTVIAPAPLSDPADKLSPLIAKPAAVVTEPPAIVSVPVISDELVSASEAPLFTVRLPTSVIDFAACAPLEIVAVVTAAPM